ncbi:MAG TPA: acyl-CoA dehydrogenase family protein, partial [Thermomonospora sp.]|nr:acyl-CoA dehydrogenase family protein [Thermomonospora sp.]
MEVAGKLAASFAAQAGERDRDRRLPAGEVADLAGSGLLGVGVPARFGGAEVRVATLAEVFRTLGRADASLAQIPHSHFVFLDALRRQGTEEQRAFYFAEALRGARFANAQSERGGRTAAEDATTLRPRDGGGYVLDGEKFYCTGALFADWLVVRAVLADRPPLPGGAPRRALAYIRRDTPGVTVEDDWDGMGQRTTASGTVRLDGVPVDEDQVVPYTSLFDGPTTYGARAQVLHAAIDAGIARGALDAAVVAVAKARPWFESGADTAAGDPLVVQQAGELEIAVRAAEALLRE